jgi:hypothetical protein
MFPNLSKDLIGFETCQVRKITNHSNQIKQRADKVRGTFCNLLKLVVGQKKKQRASYLQTAYNVSCQNTI